MNRKTRITLFSWLVLAFLVPTQVAAEIVQVTLDQSIEIKLQGVRGALRKRAMLRAGTVIAVDSEALEKVKKLPVNASDRETARAMFEFVEGIKIVRVPYRTQQYVDELNQDKLYITKMALKSARKESSLVYSLQHAASVFVDQNLSEKDPLTGWVRDMLQGPREILNVAGDQLSGRYQASTSCTGTLAQPVQIEQDGSNMRRIAGRTKATSYYIIREQDFPCSARRKTKKIFKRDHHGKVTAYAVCPKFYKHLLIEGSAKLADGKTTVNYEKYDRKRGGHLFETLDDNCRFGSGPGGCLIPWHTVAADPRYHKMGEIIFMPELVGKEMPDKSIHNGIFVVRDVGPKIKGPNRFDLFTPFESDKNNVFQRYGITGRKRSDRPLKTYVLTGDKAAKARQYLEERANKDFRMEYQEPR